MKRLDQITGALLLLFSLYYMYEASKMPMMTGKTPGAGWLPMLLGAAMALLAVMLLGSAVRRPAALDAAVIWPSGRGLTNNVAILVGLVLSVALLQVAGYVVSTLVFLFGLLLVLGGYDWKVCTLLSASSTAVLYWVFKIWLELPLPSGLLKFL